MSSSNDCWDTVFLFKGSIKQKNNMEGTSGVSIFRKEVRSFYVGCLTYIKNKFPLNDAIIKQEGTLLH
jgi:hypothetical protein